MGENVETNSHCPECGATLEPDLTCEDHFHVLLGWEQESPALAEAHPLTVLAYFLQHPGLYSPEGLEQAKRLLQDFVGGASPAEVRRRMGQKVASDRRDWRITARAGRVGRYDRPVRWRMTAADATAGGVAEAAGRVQAWTRSILQDLQASGNLE